MNAENTNKRLSPTHVLVIYSDKNRNDFYLEQREIKSIGGKTTFMAPMPLAEDVLRDVAKSYLRNTGADMQLGLIANHLLYAHHAPGKTVVIWYRPAMQCVLNFSDHLGIKCDSIVNIPATLYAVVNNNLYVFALMESDRPNASTKLYNAPYFNIYSDGRVCMGTAEVGKVKAKTFEKEAERFERAFYMAEQNGGVSAEKNCKTPLKTLWNNLISSGAPFPSKEELKQHNTYKTFAELLSKLAGYNF